MFYESMRNIFRSFILDWIEEEGDARSTIEGEKDRIFKCNDCNSLNYTLNWRKVNAVCPPWNREIASIRWFVRIEFRIESESSTRELVFDKQFVGSSLICFAISVAISILLSNIPLTCLATSHQTSSSGFLLHFVESICFAGQLIIFFSLLTRWRPNTNRFFFAPKQIEWSYGHLH